MAAGSPAAPTCRAAMSDETWQASMLFSPFTELLFLSAFLAGAAGIVFYHRSNARKARFLREYEDKITLAKYETILMQIRCHPNDQALPDEALRVGRWILSDATIKGDVADARANR